MIGKVLDNRYQLVDYVGGGGMALVYRAIDQRTGHSVAIKILRPEFTKDAEFMGRFEREAMAASKMSHHNIVNLLDVGQDKDMPYLVMEFVDGLTLKQVIEQKGALPPNVAAQIAIRILSALQHAHSNGIIHRDIKPQNILVHSDGHIKVTDFGIARVAGANTISKDDNIMGSVHYLSPEQAKGEKDVTEASDLYSAGVVLYEMLTGQPPFTGPTYVSIGMQHINAKARPISELNPAVPPAMERVVEKAMEKRPEKWYQSALEMAQDLQRALQEPDGTWLGRLPDKPAQTQEKKSTGTTQPHTPIRDKRWWLTRIAAALLVIAVIGGIAIGVKRSGDFLINYGRVPYCEGETSKDAIQWIRQAGFEVHLNQESNDVVPADQVISQSPKWGEYRRHGSVVTITVSTGPKVQAVPKVTGMNVETAKIELEKLGFTALIQPERKMDDSPWDTVLTQDPADGEMKQSGEVILLTLSGGCVTLPDLQGKTEKEAIDILDQMQLAYEILSRVVVDDASQFNRVCGQLYSDGSATYQPGDQATLQVKATLSIYISREDYEKQQSKMENEILHLEENDQ